MISVVINTLNEEKNLPRALASIKNFADEVVVVDMHSSDNTVKIAKKAGAKVYFHEKTQYVEPARNYALSKAQGEWILILDADEEIPFKLSQKIKSIVKNPEADFYRLPRKNVIFGKWMRHSRWWPDYNVRLFQKGKVTWDSEIHSVPITQGTGKDIDSKEELAIIHYNYDTLESYIDRLNRYSSIQAKSLLEKNQAFVWSDLIRRPSGEFLSRYFAGEGYKDGIHGLALALLQAFSELVVFLKLWQLKNFKEENIHLAEVVTELRKAEKEMHYWQSDTLVKTDGGLSHRIKRKFKL